MRIAYVHSRAFPSVDANVVQVVQMCRAFQSLGNDVTLFIPRHADFASDSEALSRARELFGSPLGFEVSFVQRRKVFGRMEVLGSVRSTLDALKRQPQDLVYSRNPWSVPLLRRTGTPFIWEAHEENVHKRSKLLGWLLQRLIVRTSRTSQMVKVVAISDALARVWESYGVPRDKLLTAHDGVDMNMFGNVPERDTARKELGLSSESKVVVYTGALKSDRGIEMILESARRMPDVEFWIVGGNQSEVDFWKSETDRLSLGNAHLAGRVPHRDIPRWLAAADVLLMMWTWRVPTIRVCSPMKLFEYMAAKRIIVGPAFPTVLEVLEDRKDAILFEPDNPDEMEKAVREGLSRSGETEMPARAYQKVSREYTWEARCRLILDSVKL
ncbi:glycosyltransferase family 4 protein [bacterium]|nr:glycosyltransferase family 4 protein [bacterium]